MKLTPLERQARIYKMCADDEQIKRMRPYFDPAKDLFIKLTRPLPRRLRDRLRSFPGMGRLLHNRVMALVCRNMKFLDEES